MNEGGQFEIALLPPNLWWLGQNLEIDIRSIGRQFEIADSSPAVSRRIHPFDLNDQAI